MEKISNWRESGENTSMQVAERAGIDRSTLYEIEKGTAGVSIGAYFNTNDDYGRKLQDLQLSAGTKTSKAQ